MDDITPFRVDVPEAEVERLKRKLQDTRLPPRPIVPDAGTKYGLRAPQTCLTFER